MKKFFIIIAVLVMSLAAFAGCSGGSGSSADLGDKQNTSYTVVGNGGSAVQYGNYVYFINGTRGYEDTEGTANVMGKVVKGALYRAKLNGKDVDGNFVIERNAETGLKVVATEGTDYKGGKVNVADVELVSSKTVGTSGYADGGLFIYGNYIYFASPCSSKDRDGNVMYEYNEFFRTNLSTGETQKLHTSETKNDTEPYAFYYQNGAVYLVYAELDEANTYIMSLKINENSGKVETTAKIADKVTDIVFPVKSEWNKNTDTNTVYDFVYFGGSGSDINSYRTDSIMSFMRPDGSEKTVFQSGNDAKLLGVEGGMLLYQMSYNGVTPTIMATDMHSYFMGSHKVNGEEVRNSESYYNANKDKQYNGAFTKDEIVLSTDEISSATAIDCFVPGYGVNTNAVYVVLALTNATTSSNTDLKLFAPDGSVSVVASAADADFQTYTTNKIYYTATDVNLSLYETDFAGENTVTVYDNVTVGTFAADIAGEHLVFLGAIDGGTFTGYTLFWDIYGLEGANDAFFVGQRNADDVKHNVEHIELDTDEGKLAYYVNDTLDVTGITLTAYSYPDEDGNVTVVAENIEITADMVSGFDSTTVNESLSLTVTYKGVTASYTVSVSEAPVEEAKSCGTVMLNPTDFIGGAGLLILMMGAVMLIKRRKSAVNA